MSIIEYCFGKIYRKKAQLIANKYQTQTFIKYIKKYMKKHCKLRTINMQETPELSHLIHINQYEYQYIIYFIQNVTIFAGFKIFFVHITDIINIYL